MLNFLENGQDVSLRTSAILWAAHSLTHSSNKLIDYLCTRQLHKYPKCVFSFSLHKKTRQGSYCWLLFTDKEAKVQES